MNDMWFCLASTIALPVLSLLIFWSIKSSRQKQMRRLFNHVDVQLSTASDALSHRSRPDTHTFKYDARTWIMRITPPTEYTPYRVNLTTTFVALPSWCAIEIEAQGAIFFKVRQQPLQIETPQQVHFPPMARLFKLGRFGGGGVTSFLKAYPEQLVVDMPAKTLDEAAGEVVTLLREVSSLLDVLADVIPDDAKSFWLEVCAQNSVDTALVRQALGALVRQNTDAPEVRALWLSSLSQMDDVHTMRLVQQAPSWAQDAFFEQSYARGRWMDYALASLSLETSRVVLRRSLDLACAAMPPEDLASLSDRYHRLYGDLFAWFWSEPLAALLLDLAATWWPLMSTEHWFTHITTVVTSAPHLARVEIFEGVSTRVLHLSANQNVVLAQHFARWLQHQSSLSGASVQVLTHLLPFYERDSAQLVYESFIRYAKPQHYGLIVGAVRDHQGRTQPHAVRLFRTWLASIKDDPRLAGALSTSMAPEMSGALSKGQGHEGGLTLAEGDGPSGGLTLASPGGKLTVND